VESGPFNTENVQGIFPDFSNFILGFSKTCQAKNPQNKKNHLIPKVTRVPQKNISRKKTKKNSLEKIALEKPRKSTDNIEMSKLEKLTIFLSKW
jgi:hypothetical protein